MEAMISMSIQSDVEILSVQAVEYYAQKHHLSEGDVFDLFCKHQVFEKILIQHEMLHQLDMEETFQYVEEIIKENRTKGGIQHAYDVVVGPVADDNTMETVQLYLSGILKAEEAVERLRYNKVNNQVSFHTPLALEHLTLESRREVS